MVPHALSGPFFRRGVRISALALSLLFTAVACDKVPLTAPAGTVITLVSTTNVLPINGSTDIVAVLIESGSTSTGTGTGNASTSSSGTPVHNGTLVTFTTSLGRIEPAEARTTNGRVTVKLIADNRSGTAKITAFSGSATQTTDVVIGAAAAERVQVTANPTNLPAGGGVSTITARVEDSAGNALVGVPVAFTTTSGSLNPVASTTSELGLATTLLTTTREATVTAAAGGKTGTAALTLKSASTVTLATPSGGILVGSVAAFTVTPGSGVTIRNAVIDFGDEAGPQPIGTITSATTIQHIFDDEGIFTVRVTGTDTDGVAIDGASSAVAVIPFTFSAIASPTVGSTSTVFTFTVTGWPTTVPIESVEWDFGDGNRQSSQTTSRTHTYGAPGTYTVFIRVFPPFGPSRVAQVVVTVS